MATSRVFIKGLPPNLSEADFRKHFSAKGREVTDVKLIPKRRIGYVGFKTPDDASKAVKYFNKSYIRMSKISVEPARPISESSFVSGHDVATTSHSSTSQRAPPSAPDTDQANPKKRKRDAPAPSDPKLQEFLQVMKTGREGVIADESGLNSGVDLPTNGQVATAEEESDDEYEQIPVRKEKMHKTHHSETDQTFNHVARPSGDNTSQIGTVSATVASASASASASDEVEPSKADEEKQGAAATDDDWLRSRTNRLLDLVDPEDLPPTTATLSPRKGPVKQDTVGDGELVHSSAATVTHDTTDKLDEQHATVENLETEDAADAISRTSRIFVRNLPYSATEDDLRESFGRFGNLQEVNLPVNAAGLSKGFALVLFNDAVDAVNAFQSMDGTTFQGRLLHIIPASAKRDVGLDEFGISKLPLRKQNLIRKKAEAATSSFNWNSLYMNQDAVNASVASRLGVSKSELLDPTSADAAVKQAIAETTVIQETKAFFAANGVDLEAFKSHKRGDTAILVKNFPYGTTVGELRKLFEEYGAVLKVLMPSTGTIAIVQYAQSSASKTAFAKLAYRRIKDSVLFLEKAPRDLFKAESADSTAAPVDQQPAGIQKLSVSELLSGADKPDDGVETASLFVRNLNFATTTGRLAEAFEPLDGFVAARVKTKTDPKKPGQTLSMGFGFVEFRSKEQAQAALKAMDGFVLDEHTLGVKASHKGHDAAEERRREDKAKKSAAKRTKIVIKNLPFQATKKDVRALLGTYGQLRSVRVPKKADYTTRGFAFADFVSSREAENALNALRDTHLLGRRLVLDFAEADALDAEEEIEKMQRKVGGQVNKVALQQLTGGGRKRVNIGNDEEALDV